MTCQANTQNPLGWFGWFGVVRVVGVGRWSPPGRRMGVGVEAPTITIASARGWLGGARSDAWRA
jgi:hypothetical protein